MRLLVACPQCKRQYDASSRAIGSRFRCYCGAAVTVQQPKGHDAAVVRCSSCGAPRAEGSTSCRYCGSDFTIHEQDLDTVCPRCFARVSDRAKFCHYCGITLRPESPAIEKTELGCPACGEATVLSHRQVGDVAVLECRRCGGFWLGAHVLEELIEKASQGVEVGDFRLRGPVPTAPGEPCQQLGPLYRKCPVCAKLMHRDNYAHRSGVIIDVCKDHGVWFDVDELARILDWVRSGAKAEVDRRDATEAEHQEKMAKIAAAGERERMRERYGGGDTGGFYPTYRDEASLIEVLVDIAAMVFSSARHWWR
jgi:Zn-finger nucleic acid-binding protein/ribosomal protein L40E